MVSSASVFTAFVLILLSVGSHAASTRLLKQEELPSSPMASASASASVETTPVELPPPSISISVNATTGEVVEMPSAGDSTPPEEPPVATTSPPESPADPPMPPVDTPPMTASPPESPADTPMPPVDTPPTTASPPESPADPPMPPVDTPPTTASPPESPADPVMPPEEPPVDTTSPPTSPADPPIPPVDTPPVDTSPDMTPPKCPPKLCKAAKRRDESVVRAAIKAGEPNLCDCVCDTATGDTLLHVTACSEAVAFAFLLLESQPMCDVDIMDAEGNSPLHEASECCNAPMAFNFLRFGADTEKRNDAELTPLCVVALQNSETCGQLVVQLVEFGADICAECPTPDGPMLPVDVAVNSVVKDVIIQNGGNPVGLPGGTC